MLNRPQRPRLKEVSGDSCSERNGNSRTRLENTGHFENVGRYRPPWLDRARPDAMGVPPVYVP